MTIAVEAARQVAAERYQAATVQSAEAHRAAALAEQQRQVAAAEAAVAHRAATPVVIDDGAVPVAAPAPATVAQPSGPAADTPPEMPLDGRSWASPSQIMERWSKDGVGVVAIEHWRRDGADPAADLAFAVPVVTGVLSGLDDSDLSAMQGIIAELGPGFEARLCKAASAYGRLTAPTAGDPASLTLTPTQPRGNPMPAETLSRADAQKRYGELTKKIHDARFRGDHMAVRELDAERERLGAALYPGSSGPAPDQQRTIG